VNVVSTTETQEQATSQNGGGAAEAGGTGDSGARKALKVGALAAAAGTAAFAASKAMSSRSDDEGKSGSESGSDESRGGRASMDQLVSAIGSARWDVLKEIVVPFAESGATSAGAFMAKEAPDFLSDTLVPKFIEGFNKERGEKAG
jgi:hypothetical protein